MKLADGIVNINPVAIPKESILPLYAFYSIPRHQKGRMKCPEQEEYVKINSSIGKDNTNDASIAKEDGAEPGEWRVVCTAYWSRLNRVTCSKRIPAEARYNKANENPHANKEKRKE